MSVSDSYLQAITPYKPPIPEKIFLNLRMATPIVISNISGQHFIWDALDAVRVREEFRIVGTLVGCLPRKPLQNVHNGLPLQLMNYEVKLLLEKGFAVLCDDMKCKTLEQEDLESKHEEKVLEFEAERKRLYAEQVEACAEDKKRLVDENFDKICKGKRSKLEESSATCEVDESLLKNEISERIEKMHQQLLPEKASCIQIHTAAATGSLRVDSSLPLVDVSTILTTKIQQNNYRVFKHFWEQGFFLTSGAKFGGDFLVYPGDPSRFHSFYIVICMGDDKSLSSLEIIRLGRLGTNVKKTVVLCSVDVETNVVNCISLQWTKIN